MADIRIKDLTTLASASLTGDVFVIDGTTGTRKLSAFSPTFGGNATVTGTLTVNGALSSTSSTNDYGWSVTGSGIGGPYITLDATNATTSNRFTGLLLKNNGTLQWVAQLRAGDGNFHIYDAVRSVSTLTIAPGALNGVAGTSTFAGAVAITSTSSSTTTSSGALVVGNGTSGGLGVGGALNVGGQIRAQLGLFAGSPPAGLASAYQVDVDAGTSRDILSWGDSSRVGLIRGEQDGSGRATLKFGRYTASTFAEYFRVTGLAATDAIVNIYGTTASTSTSSGALVVSGGVGIGGSLNAGANNAANSITGGDSGSGTYILQLKDGGGNLKVNFKGNGDVNLQSSTASTTTSSGALVVAGGVGVAGAIYAGGYASTASHARIGASGSVVALSAANNVDSGLPAAWNGNYGLGVYYSAASTNTILIGDGSAGSTIFATRTGSANTSRVTIDNANGNLSIASTTNASSTSFAALVVSGGVGVAKRIVSGEGLTTNGDNEAQITFTRNGTISIGPTSAATPKLAVGGGLQLSNTSQSISAWGDIGPQLSIAGAVVTDTTSSGTVSRAVANSINATAFAASSSTTYTQAVSLFIADAPTANTNVTITHRYALYTAGGRINFQGLPTSSAGLQAGTLWNDGGTLKVA